MKRLVFHPHLHDPDGVRLQLLHEPDVLRQRLDRGAAEVVEEGLRGRVLLKQPADGAALSASYAKGPNVYPLPEECLCHSPGSASARGRGRLNAGGVAANVAEGGAHLGIDDLPRLSQRSLLRLGQP